MFDHGGRFLDREEIVDPSRLRRERARWAGIEDVDRLATITVLDHGGRARPVINRGQRHLRSRIVSRKTRRLQITEGKGLRFLVLRCEVDGIVIDYEAHPFRVDVVAGGRRLTWFPDLVRVRRGRPIEIIEVKRSVADVRKEDYATKLDAMRETFRRIGWRMRILYDEDIFGEEQVAKTRASNVAAVHSRRALKVMPEEKAAVASVVAGGGEVAWRNVRDLVSPNDPLRGDAVVEWAVARGRLLIDFDEPRRPDTPVYPLARPAPAPSIRFPR